MTRWRIGLAGAGILLGGYGVLRLVTQNSVAALTALALWLVAAVAIHDGLLSPVVLSIGRGLSWFPARARRYLQAGLLIAALLTVVAAPLIFRRGTQPASKALLVQDYGAHLALLLALVAAGSLLGYAVAVAHRSRRPMR